MRFDGKIALVTGGSAGIGLATARRLRDEGARVVITGRDQARLEAAAGANVLAARGDASRPDDLDAVMDTIRDRFGGLDVVFANAGAAAFRPNAEITEAEFDRVADSNFKAAFFTVQKSVPLLRSPASIVLNASWAVHRGVPGSAVYAAAKAAAHNLAPAYAAELAGTGIRVNSVSPGYIATGSFREHVSTEAQVVAAAAVAAGRLGTPEDVAAVVAFLASEDAAYVNGQDLLVDGGLITTTPAPML
ncbi:SDR family NAD(P)-dependent oxidoreductase [Amycolatopsis sp. YIM 10]|uniref:SDR family NAD(P)-dependent oxidoreductase n=1 Tax=Amycolatopsis sp. YIM 10 TaxID=2653857 RepID=UPI00128FDA81|nr:SDR family oxidoreductase [Amycolatopsis sp. YIM 10]QFU90366.1 3-oxoacyl-[acyl-carrier-protein] reductase FabG [Amycolatopsis sp. YIM 10]